jgi:hypothetical protein
MTQRTFQAQTPLQALVLEQALLLARQLEQAARDAPDGHVLAKVEAAAVPAARELARLAVQAALQSQAEAAEKKGAPGRACACGRRLWNKGTAGRNVLTAAGAIRLERLYVVCPRCRAGRYPLDDRLGLDGFVSPQARKLLCLAGASWSFAAAAEHLKELCGLATCGQTVRAVCHREAGLMADWLHAGAAAGAAFAAAEGDVEFQTDGTMVNTWEGWREMRLGVFAKRPRGRPAKPAEWDARRLPAPAARAPCAAVEAAVHFGPRVRRWAARLGVKEASAVTVLADGADWIWAQARRQLPGAGGLLDIYHACEHLGGAARALFGEGAAEAAAWVGAGRLALLTGGAAGVQEYLAAALAGVRSAARRQALGEAARYFGRRSEYLGYAARLAAGQSIGSGLVEGACKQVIGRRMKQTGARWRVRRANRMATLCCTLHGDSWGDYWEHLLN